jgi:hypothetical protein
MKHSPKTSVASGTGARLLTVQFEIDPPAPIYVRVRAVQSYDALQPAERPMPARGPHEWMPNLYTRRFLYLRAISVQEAISSLDPECEIEFKNANGLKT